MTNYYTSGKIAPSIYAMMQKAGATKINNMSELYAQRAQKNLEEIEQAKQRLQSSLGNYMTVLERMVLAEGRGIALGMQMASLIGSGRIDLNFLATQGFSYDGWGITSSSLQDAVFKYQDAVSQGQHSLNKMLESITGGKMYYKIAIASDTGSKAAPIEFTLNLDQVLKMETDKNMFNIGVSGTQLQRALMTGDYSTLSFSQHTNKANLQTGEIITNSVMRKYLGQLTSSTGESLDATKWAYASDFRRDTDVSKKVRPSDAYEIYTSLKNGVIAEADFEGQQKRLWKHDSSPGLVGGDVNYYNKATQQFTMIQNKFFNQAKGYYNKTLGQEVFTRTNEEFARYQQFHGFFSFSNLNNIEQGLYAYMQGFKKPQFNWDQLKGSNVSDQISERISSVAENDVYGWMEE